MKKKLFLTVFILSSFAFGIALGVAETKKQKIEQVFSLTNDSQMYTEAFEPLFANANITDEKTKKIAIDRYITVLREAYLEAYDKFFDTTNIDAMLKYYSSSTGKRFTASAFELATMMQPAYSSIMAIIQEITSAQKQPEAVAQPTAASFAESPKNTKQQKIKQLFNLTNNKQTYTKAYEPLFVGFGITDQKVKEQAIDRFFTSLREVYTTAYDKLFDETNVDEMIDFHGSETGKCLMEKAAEIGAEQQKAYASIMSIVQELAPAQPTASKSAPLVKSSAVTHFDEMIEGKNDTEVRDLFKQTVEFDGVTVVKFSSSWCPPCKVYAPIFNEVAEQLKETSVNGKKFSIHYLAIDTDAAPTIAKDCSIMSIPATVFYKNGKQIDSKVGSIKKDALIAQIKEVAKK